MVNTSIIDCYIENKDRNKVSKPILGQRVGLSDLDAKGINMRYGCEDIGRFKLLLLFGNKVEKFRSNAWWKWIVLR